ncbi:MAG: Hpt domain-containing protein [Roseburia sp.]|nr:Hpt domain-containing protein [Anaeroplasma bactoclasticum]MCM1195649.1 Hpt domain-containing protein [Roseburia sp.]MCM1556607.1 Hpt domain-containing protein [Anaeroplasma bactoclasticum]
MNLQEFYNSIHVNPTEVMHRFGNNEEMLAKFLRKFLEDKTFLELTQAVENKDWEIVFRTAHTLKGLSVNFDFKELFELSSKIVERYRAQDYEVISEWFERLKICYQTLVDNLRRYLEE